MAMLLRERGLAALKNAARLALTQGVGRGSAWFALGRFREGRGDLLGATSAYERALAAADAADARWVFKSRQAWQFHLERMKYVLGEPRVDDPLFACVSRACASSGRSARNQKRAPGFFQLAWTHLGLRVDGFLLKGRPAYVELELDGKPLRRLAVVKRRYAPRYFHFQIKRPTLEHFPAASRVRLLTPEGDELLWSGCEEAELLIPHGKGTLLDILTQGGTIDKKGFIGASAEEVVARQSRYLEIYEQARRAFDEAIGTPLFLVYGTLLGFYREGDFIPGDDDFDVGYVSYQSDPAAVKEEAKRIVLSLVKAGFHVSFNRQGRLFRLSLPGYDAHLDVRPLWQQDGYVWAHKQARLPCTLDDFLPVQEGELRGTKVFVPARPERFLRTYYGPGWKVPDPGYTNTPDKAAKQIRRNLSKACITVGEYRAMQRELAASTDGEVAGRLVSIGTHSLYPLAEYEAVCEW